MANKKQVGATTGNAADEHSPSRYSSLDMGLGFLKKKPTPTASPSPTPSVGRSTNRDINDQLKALETEDEKERRK